MLQMPPKDPNLSLARNRKQSTPEFEQREVYGSPSSVLPRHSRGLDFSRACTNLHHSTLADHSSPASSPTLTQKGINIPSRRPSVLNLDNNRPISMWGGIGERGFYPRSFGSTTALTSDASSSDSDDDDISMRVDDPEDQIMTTPQLRRGDVTPFNGARSSVSRNLKAISPMNFHLTQHARGGRARQNPMSHVNTRMGGYFGMDEPHPSELGSTDVDMLSVTSRRESLSFGANNLRISIGTGNDSGNGNGNGSSSQDDQQSMPAPSTPGVVRRAVTRRSNLLPKSKGFARVRAALQEETQPIDSEAAREAEIVRQVKVNDVGTRATQTPSESASPHLAPAILQQASEMSDVMSDVDSQSASDGTADRRRPDEQRTFSSKEFWPHIYGTSRQTPPPPLFHRKRSSSGMSEDIGPDNETIIARPSSVSTDMPDIKPSTEASSNFSTPNLPSAAEMTRKINNKRRRDEDFDPASIKRRAVSPGMSVHSSPVTGQSPVSNTGSWPTAVPPKPHRESTGGASSADERSQSVGAMTPHLGPKRVGFQGMTDTNDGLMKMSID